jgi:hypothetical protein
MNSGLFNRLAISCMLMFCPNIGDGISSVEHILLLANIPVFGGDIAPLPHLPVLIPEVFLTRHGKVQNVSGR